MLEQRRAMAAVHAERDALVASGVLELIPVTDPEYDTKRAYTV